VCGALAVCGESGFPGEELRASRSEGSGQFETNLDHYLVTPTGWPSCARLCYSSSRSSIGSL